MIQSQPAIQPSSGSVQSLRAILGDGANPLKRLARNRGWPYLIAWCHRISGVLLLAYVGFHILTLSALQQPERFAGLMQFYGFFLFAVLEWTLAIPVVFHAVNGGRLILYEVFGNRRDDPVIRWVVWLSGGYVLLLAVVMIMGNQTVSAVFFWLYTAAAAGCLATITLSGIRLSGAGVFWKLQRVTGAYLLLMVPAHMLFMHLNPSLGHDARIIVERMNSGFIRLVDLTLVLCVLYHGAYGLFTIGRDYLPPGRIRITAGVLVAAVMTVLVWIGVKLTMMV
jgi:succinate dehydrogenase cytochrome b556 subunit